MAARALAPHGQQAAPRRGGPCRRARRAGDPPGSDGGPLNHTAAGVRGRGELVGEPDVTAQSWRAGTRARNASAPSSTAGRPANGVGADLPAEPVGLPDLDADTSGGQAGQVVGGRRSPVIPAPMTNVPRRGRHGATRTRSASAAEDGRVVVHRGRAGERQPEPGGLLAGLDVEVVEHLEVVGDEPARAHEQPIGSLPASSSTTARTSGPSHGSGVRPADCHANAPAAHGAGRPARRRLGVAASSSGYGSPASRIRRQGVGGEDDLGVRPAVGQPGAARRRPGTRRTPARWPTTRCRRTAARRSAAAAPPAEVLADRQRRSSGGQHETDDALDAGRRERRPGLDLRVGVLEAETDGEGARRPLVERGLQPVALALGDVASGEIPPIAS